MLSPETATFSDAGFLGLGRLGLPVGSCHPVCMKSDALALRARGLNGGFTPPATDAMSDDLLAELAGEADPAECMLSLGVFALLSSSCLQDDSSKAQYLTQC